MKSRNRLRNILLISFAVISVAAAGIGEAWAYFTTYATAQGGYTIQLGYETEMKEEYENWVKSIEISNKEGSQPVYIRARAFSGAQYKLNYSSENDSWYDGGDGYWYYEPILYGGDQTEALKVSIENIPEKPKDGFEFNVVVIYESTPVRYKADGTAYADWDATLDTGKWEGGNEG